MLNYDSYYLVTNDFPASATTKSSRLAAQIVFHDGLEVGEAGYIAAPPNVPQRREFLVTESKDPNFEPHWITITDYGHLNVGTGTMPDNVADIDLSEQDMVIRHIDAADIHQASESVLPNGLFRDICRMANVDTVTSGLLGVEYTDHACLVNLVSPRSNGSYRSQLFRIDIYTTRDPMDLEIKGYSDSIVTVSDEFIYSKPMLLGKNTIHYVVLTPSDGVREDMLAAEPTETLIPTPTEELLVKDNEVKEVEADLIADIAAIRQALRRANRWIPRTGMFVVIDHGTEPYVIVDYDAYEDTFYLEKADSARRSRDYEELVGSDYGRTSRSSGRSSRGICRIAQGRVSPFYLEG